VTEAKLEWGIVAIVLAIIYPIALWCWLISKRKRS
jgi:hypothetical protein